MTNSMTQAQTNLVIDIKNELEMNSEKLNPKSSGFVTSFLEKEAEYEEKTRMSPSQESWLKDCYKQMTGDEYDNR